MACYRRGGCGPYEGLSCNECPARNPEYADGYSKKESKKSDYPVNNESTILEDAYAELCIEYSALVRENESLKDEIGRLKANIDNLLEDGFEAISLDYSDLVQENEKLKKEIDSLQGFIDDLTVESEEAKERAEQNFQTVQRLIEIVYVLEDLR